MFGSWLLLIPAILIVGVPFYLLGRWRERRRWEGSKLVLDMADL
jgi:cytochrome c oxidase assembly factor CtaG